MNKLSTSRSRRLRASLAAVMTLVSLSWLNSASAQSRPFNIPDLSSYNCAAVDAATAAGVRHMGQVINGRYHEWHEIYATVGGKQRLACISLIVPEARQMSVSEARAFLKNATNVGAPSADPAATSEEPHASQNVVIEPPNVQPMPLKRAIRPAPGTGLAEKKAGEIEVPPIPAIKSFKKATPLPAKENSHGAAASTAPPISFAAPQTVGVEDRVKVSNTLVYPWNTVGYLSVTFPSGNSFRCSGVLVSAYVVLTAGHCIHDQGEGGFADQARFYPAQHQNTPGDRTPIRPFANSNLAFIKTTQTWTKISGEDSYIVTDYKHDFATVQFNTPFTFTSTFMAVAFSDTTASITSTGYPANVNGQNVFGQYTDDGSATAKSGGLENSHVREFEVDGSGGSSGGPFYVVDQGTGLGRLVGILSYGNDLDDQSGGPWYDSFSQSLVSNWISWTPGAAASASTDGLRVAAVFSSAQSSSRSFLRFYNSGSSSGTVEVTLADYQTGGVLGTWTSSSIAAGSELQFFIQDLENNADSSFSVPSFYSVSIRPTFSGYFQHVLWKPANGTLTNLSTCDTMTTSDTTTAIGVHSSLLSNGYPSTLIVHNTGSSAANLMLGIYDARTGNKITDYWAGQIPANGQAIRTVSEIEAALVPPLQPSGDMYHYVVKVESNLTGYVQHLVENQSAGLVTDMTAACALVP